MSNETLARAIFAWLNLHIPACSICMGTAGGAWLDTINRKSIAFD